MAKYQVTVFDGTRTIRKEVFHNEHCAWAFFDAFADNYKVEFKDLSQYSKWRLTAV